jgi:hypothetical protein
MSNVLLGPGATGIVGAAGGAMHAAKDMVAANAAAICGWKRFMVLPPYGKLSLRRAMIGRGTAAPIGGIRYSAAIPITANPSRSRELFQENLCLFEVGGVEAFREPAVDWREQLTPIGAPAVFAPQPGEARRGA